MIRGRPFVKKKHLRITQEGQVLCRRFPSSSAGRQVRYLIEILCREVGRVELILEVGHERCINVADSCPVNPVEEGVALDLIDVQSVIGSSQQPRDEKDENEDSRLHDSRLAFEPCPLLHG